MQLCFFVLYLSPKCVKVKFQISEVQIQYLMRESEKMKKKETTPIDPTETSKIKMWDNKGYVCHVRKGFHTNSLKKKNGHN